MTTKRILILGGSGFIGQALYRELCPYYNTYATFCSNKGYGNNHQYYNFNAAEEGLEPILKEVRPHLIISAMRGDFDLQIELHDFLVSYIKNANCRLFFLSSANVFDAFHHFPSYEYDKTYSESIYGRFKIKIESRLLRLPPTKYVIARLPMIFGQHAPRTVQIDKAVQQHQPIEVFPNTIINVNGIQKLTQQIHFIINQKRTGIFHLGSTDLISHYDFIRQIVARRHHKPGIFKQVFTTNNTRYLATLPKENNLPTHLLTSYNEVLDEMDLIRKNL